MELVLTRRASQNGATVGRLDVDDIHQCYICEDVIREVPGVPVAEWKVPGQTAIPAGRYRVVITFSNRFQRELPLLLDVPGFTGIRIHPGNTNADTEGCLLPGLAVGDDGNSVVSSRAAFAVLMDKIRLGLSGGEVWITIKNPAEMQVAA